MNDTTDVRGFTVDDGDEQRDLRGRVIVPPEKRREAIQFHLPAARFHIREIKKTTMLESNTALCEVIEHCLDELFDL